METLPKTESALVRKDLMLAALQCASTDTEAAAALCGVHICGHDGDIHVVATDGGRMLVGREPLASKPKPAKWLKDGVTVSSEGLKKRLALFDSNNVWIEWAPGLAKVILRDEAGNDQFRLPIVEAAYPDYLRMLENVDIDDGTAASEPVGLNSKYMKAVADLANIFKDMLPEDVRKAKTGMPIRAYAQAPDKPVWFTFEYVPGVVLIQMPVVVAPVAPETVRLMAPAMRASLAATKANRTRTAEWAKNAATAEERNMYLEKVADYDARIAAIVQSMQTALPAPAAAAAPPAPAPSPNPAPAAKPEAKADGAAKPGEAPAPAKPDEGKPVETPKPTASAAAPAEGPKAPAPKPVPPRHGKPQHGKVNQTGRNA